MIDKCIKQQATSHRQSHHFKRRQKRLMNIALLMRKLVIGVALFSSMPLLAVSEAQANTSLIITNTIVINIRNGEKTAADILITGDRITDIQPHGTFSHTNNKRLKNAKVIDATGQYAIPGLWDMHVHLTKSPELQDKISALFIANGITSVRDLGAEVDDILAFQQRVNQPGAIAPKIWSAGPLFDGVPPIFDGKPGVSAHEYDPAISTPVATPEAAVALVDKLAENGFKLIKPYETLRPAVFSAMVKRAHEHDLPVDGHIPMRMTILEAIDAGLDGVQHLKGVDYGCAHNPQALKEERLAILDQAGKNARGVDLFVAVFTNVVTKALAQQDSDRCDALIQTFVERSIWHTPTLSTEAFLFMSDSELMAWHETLKYLPIPFQTQAKAIQAKLSGATSASTPNSEKMLASINVMKNKYSWKRNTIKKMHQAGVQFLAGTDTPTLLVPGFSLHDELRVLVTQGGLSSLAVLQAATLNPAKFFNIEDKQGAIETGKIADIILLNADPLADISNTRKINTVIARGQVFDRLALDTLLAN